MTEHAPNPLTVIPMRQEEIEKYTWALSDVLCWIIGFRAALPEDTSKELPPAWEDLRKLNITLKEHLK